jgi:hypothetical protein
MLLSPTISLTVEPYLVILFVVKFAESARDTVRYEGEG